MKKSFLLIALVAITLVIICCSEENNSKKVAAEESVASKDSILNLTIPEFQIPVGKENFKRLISLIEKNGSVIPECCFPYDYQYNFFDKNGNRLSLMTNRRDTTNVRIWVCVTKDKDPFLLYEITKDQVSLYIKKIDQKSGDIKDGAFGPMTKAE